MTREEAIELLENLKVCKQAHTLFNIEKEAVDMAIEALTENESLAKSVIEASELLHKKRPQWIPCSERLPEPDKYVLVCSDEGYIEVAEGYISTEIEEFVWLTSGWRFGKVVAWMPLPEPYKRGEAE